MAYGFQSKLKQIEVSIADAKTKLKQKIDTVSIQQQLVALSNAQKAAMAARDEKVEPFSVLADVFLRLIKMIVAPLVLTTLIVAFKLGDIKSRWSDWR